MAIPDQASTCGNVSPPSKVGSEADRTPVNAGLSASDVKSIKIHSGVVRRLCKEHTYYVGECESLLKRIEDMKVCLDRAHFFQHSPSHRTLVCTTLSK